MRVFLSHRFDPADTAARTSINWIDDILRSFEIEPVDGRALGGGPLNAQIEARIRECSALISVFTPATTPPPAGAVPTSEYVKSEYQFASNAGMYAIPVMADGAHPPSGLAADHERVELSLANPAPGLLKLIQIVGLWRQRVGNVAKVRLEPVEIARKLASSLVADCCEARVTGSVAGKWQPVRVMRQPGGVFVAVPGVRPDSKIQIRARLPQGGTWESAEHAYDPWVAAPLEEV